MKNIFSGFDVIHSFNMLSHINKNFATYNEQLDKLTEKLKSTEAALSKTSELMGTVVVKANVDHLLGQTDGRENKEQTR